MSSGPQLLLQIPWVQEQGFTDLRQLQARSTIRPRMCSGLSLGSGCCSFSKRVQRTGEGESKNGLGLSILDIPVGLGCFLLAFPFIRLMQILGEFAYVQTQACRAEWHGTSETLHDIGE